jgi:hypothetical protein
MYKKKSKKNRNHRTGNRQHSVFLLKGKNAKNWVKLPHPERPCPSQGLFSKKEKTRDSPELKHTGSSTVFRPYLDRIMTVS